jgi:A/G-specific adenine glycosylase
MTAAEAPAIELLAGLDLAGLDLVRFRQAVLAWFDSRGRVFPFRGTTDPYLVLVSEVLLQQTQISRGGPAWVRFTATFPTVQALAAASPADVLRAWQGLGYNRRAVNLQRAARIIVDDLAGQVPDSVAGLEALPGVGPYTARAVASIAFKVPVGAVDTNVRRVLGRVLAGDPAAIRPAELQRAADRIVDPEQPDDWTHALMDIGSTLCRPVRPRCAECPVQTMCRYASGERPAKARAMPAGRGATNGTSANSAPPFSRSSRWLRGRILDQLRAASGDAWTRVPARIGDHDADAIGTALEALERDHLVELDLSGPGRPRARLPIA